MSDAALTFSSSEHVSEEAVRILVEHIDSEISEIQKVYWEWPSGNQVLQMPSILLQTSGDADFAKSMNKPIRKISDIDAVTKKVQVLRDVGQYEYSFQLDLWARNKNERSNLLGKIEELLNPEDIDLEFSGLNLRMPKYFNQLCCFTMRGYTYEDGEISAQRREWRAMVDIVAHVTALRLYEGYGIETTDIELETLDEFESID